MKILYKDLAQRLYPKPDINELSERLFQLGHEHEISGEIFDMELTPNRGDCLSVNGLLRDLNLFYYANIEYDIYEDEIMPLKLDFKNNAKNFCPNISFLKIEIDAVPSKYSKTLENYFASFGINKNNFFTDISNYISYETGQPTHCYSSKKLTSHLRLDYTDYKFEFETLLEKKIELKNKNLIFIDENEEVINLAGVIGGKNTACDKNTTSVIIECAYFQPEVIIGKAIEYNIVSDAAHKFERNTDIACHDFVLRRFIKIVEEHANIKSVEIYSKNIINKNNLIKFNSEKVNEILGTKISKADQISYLNKLGFLKENDELIIPTYRNDIETINDIAEEVARSIGYNIIEPKKVKINFKQENSFNDNEDKIKSLLINNGFYEVINDPFVAKKEKNSIKVDNPLDTNRKYLRTSLKDSLINNLQYNERRQKDSVKLFEIADIYNINSTKRMLGIIASGRVGNNYRDFAKKISSKYILNILNSNLSNIEINQFDIPRELINSKRKNPIVYIEAEINDFVSIDYQSSIERGFIDKYKYKPISEYPSSTRDLSFSVKDFSNYSLLKDFILNFKNDLLKEVFIFDFYINEKMQDIKIGFRFIFQSKKSTITDEEVNDLMNQIIEKATKFKKVNIPGI